MTVKIYRNYNVLGMNTISYSDVPADVYDAFTVVIPAELNPYVNSFDQIVIAPEDTSPVLLHDCLGNGYGKNDALCIRWVDDHFVSHWMTNIRMYKDF